MLFMQHLSNILNEHPKGSKCDVGCTDFCLSLYMFFSLLVLICQKVRPLLQLPLEESLMPKNEAEILKGGAVLEKKMMFNCMCFC